jgi:hypothetical protein
MDGAAHGVSLRTRFSLRHRWCVDGRHKAGHDGKGGGADGESAVSVAEGVVPDGEGAVRNGEEV